jgi:hypothetical protein
MSYPPKLKLQFRSISAYNHAGGPPILKTRMLPRHPPTTSAGPSPGIILEVTLYFKPAFLKCPPKVGWELGKAKIVELLHLTGGK